MRSPFLLVPSLFLGCATTGTTSTADPKASELVCPIDPHRATGQTEIAPSTSPHAAVFVLQNASLIDGTGGEPRVNVDVVVRDGRVAELGEDMPVPEGAGVLDLAGRTLLPGFIDAHVHLTGDPASGYAASVERAMRESEADAALRGARNAEATLLAGFTTVRNVGGSFADRALRDAIARGFTVGPRMLVANYSIGITGGHCDDTSGLRPRVHGDDIGVREGIADGVDDVRKAVRYQVKYGADVIKICATGGVLSQGDGVGAPQLTLDEMRAIVEEANRAERKVAAHAHGNLGIRDAVAAGVHSIEHGSILDAETIAAMKRRGTFLVPTTYVGKVVEDQGARGLISPHSAAKAKEIGPKMRESFKLAYASGVKIALGSDAGVFAHGENAREFSTMVDLGMKAMDAIVAGTSGAAELLGLTDVGRIEVGAWADLVVVEGDPLSDIRLLEQPAMVMKGGVIHLPPRWQADHAVPRAAAPTSEAAQP